MDRIVNLSILAHPFNWLTLMLWLLAIGFLVNHASNMPLHASLTATGRPGTA